MRFILTEEFWALDALSPAEWHLVSGLPAAAAGEEVSPAALERLYPPPVDEDDAGVEDLEDWEDYVRPDMENLFQEARQVVEGDLGEVEVLEPEDIFSPEDLEEYSALLPELRRVRVPLENTEAWYSTLNQARLLMNEEHDLAESEERFLAHLEDAEEIDEDRILLIAQYELYSAVQIMLVENIMGT